MNFGQNVYTFAYIKHVQNATHFAAQSAKADWAVQIYMLTCIFAWASRLSPTGVNFLFKNWPNDQFLANFSLFLRDSWGVGLDSIEGGPFGGSLKNKNNLKVTLFILI